jgi:hypothetical protein
MPAEKSVVVGMRVPESVKKDLENAAWAEGTSISQLALEGILAVLGPIRKKHGGSIPQKPHHKAFTGAVPVTESETTKKRKRKRRKD